MKTSDTGKSIIRTFEGLRIRSYKCPAGVWTVGYGHTNGVTANMVIDENTAERFLDEDLRGIEEYLNIQFPWLTQNKFDAMASFIFNVGLGAFKCSTLCTQLSRKASDMVICNQLFRWVYAAGKPLVGLARRRVAEANRWMDDGFFTLVIQKDYFYIIPT